MEQSKTILRVQDLTKIYGSGTARVAALQNVSFEVKQGEFVAIVGPSGSGKSTLLHMIGGVDTPTSGTVEVDGTDLASLDESRLAVFRRRPSMATVQSPARTPST